MSLLPAAYRILSNTLASSLTPYMDEIIVDLQCEIRRNRSTTGQVFSQYISYLQILRRLMTKSG